VADPVNAQEQLTGIAADLQLGSTPLTVDLVPERSFEAALRAGDDVLIALAVEGIEGTTVQPFRINVFVDKTDADSRTATDAANWIGFIQLLPVRGAVRRFGHAFNLPRIRDLELDKPIRITLVPVVGVDSVPGGTSLRIARMYLRRER
jgi:hypothetical protein